MAAVARATMGFSLLLTPTSQRQRFTPASTLEPERRPTLMELRQRSPQSTPGPRGISATGCRQRSTPDSPGRPNRFQGLRHRHLVDLGCLLDLAATLEPHSAT